MKQTSFLLLFSFFVVLSPISNACSTFTLEKDGRFVYGRNLDWHVDSGSIVVNQRNVFKKAMVIPLSKREVDPIEWTSRYGSVTFNGLGREFPNGGMNEAGLTLDIMWLSSTRYPKADERKEISVLQWGQYLLDTCATVEDVLASMEKVRISEDGVPPQHYLIADRNGNTLVVDFVDGEARTYTEKSLPYCALTNSTYEESMTFAGQYAGLGGQKAIPMGAGSLNRYARVAYGVKKFASLDKDIVEHSFDILHGVNAGYEPNQHSTVWSIVYDISGKKIYYRTNSNRNIRSIDVSALDYTNGKPVRVWNVLNDLSGDITDKSIPYSQELNKEIVTKQITNPGVIKSAGDMRALIEPASAYPELFTKNK